MPNYALPVQDVALGSWTEGAGDGDANAWDELDEGFGAGRGTGSGPDGSTTYWQSEQRITTGDYTTLEVKLDSVPTPPTRLQHIVRVHWRKGAAGGVQVNAKFQLYQGTMAITGVQTVTNIAATWQTTSYTLAEAEASSITDYSDLRVRVWGSSIADGLQRAIWLSAIELEVPAKLTASLAGTLATAGAHTGKVKANLAGTLTTAGSLAINIIRKVTVAGTLTTAGAVAVKRTLKANLGGTLTTAGTHVGKVKARLAGALATAGAHGGKVKAVLSGALSAYGVLVLRFRQAFTGTLATSGALASRRIRKVTVTGTLATAGVLAGIKRVTWQGLRRLRAVITDAIGNIKGHILP